MNKPNIEAEQFFSVDMRVGTILSAERFAKAKKPAYQLTIDFGPLGIRHSSAQITQRYQPNDLIGRQVVAVVNLPPRNIAGFSSEVLVLGSMGEDGDVILLRPDERAENGSPIG
ncbi:tRNA-binding protein [Alicyclobacillus tolerans]|uniref:tRNA-binding protein n=1 Tax=Alicyclobacillus tolerans TaxID=90970 RepID=UPI003B7DB1EE